MKVKLYIVLVFSAFWAVNGLSQADSLVSNSHILTDSIGVMDTSMFELGSMVIDSLWPDTLSEERQVNHIPSGVKLSKDSLDTPVDYGARDSSRYDNVNRIFHLYGEAYVEYQEYSIKADYITVNMNNNIATAYARVDSISGIATGKPVFQDAQNNFSANKMRFNFKTKKGMIYEAITQENDILIHGGKTKFVAEDAKLDREDDIIYNKDALFTTCNHEEPHYGIRSNKQKIIPGKLIVVGPSHVEIAGISTPLWLPFGFFPITSTSRHGLLFPKDYEFSPSYGYGFNDIGYFVPIGEYANLSATVDIYTRGTFRTHLNSQYRKKYKYSGNLNFNYASLKDEDINTATYLRNKSWGLDWSHSQDAKAHPSRRFSGSVRLQSGNYQKRNLNDFQSATNNTISSNLNYTKTFQNSPFSLTASMNHSQSTQTRMVTATLPKVQLKMQRINPFKKKISSGTKKWFENITLLYDIEAQNRIRASDTTIFTQNTIDNMQYAIKHNASSGLNFKVAKFFNVTPNIRYSETYNFKSIKYDHDPTWIIDETVTDEGVIERDTTFGKINEITENRFSSFRDFNAGVSVSTKVFGTMQFKKGKIRGIRHIITPTLSYNFHPDLSNEEQFIAYFDTTGVHASLDPDPFEYNILSNSPYGRPSSRGTSQTLSYNIQNILETKIYSKKDSTTKKIKFFDSFNIGGNYNFEADSLKFSLINLSAVTRLFGGVTTITYRAVYDLYELRDGKRVDNFVYNANNHLLRFDNANIRVSTTLRIPDIANLFGVKNSTDRFINLFDQFTIRHNFTYNFFDDGDGLKTEVGTNNISTSGLIPLSEKWNLRLGQIGYDFKRKGVTYPDFTLTRDLHCWEMGISTQPLRGTFAFYIRVKPGSLDFLNLPFDRRRQDAGGTIF